jgi:hypothetical protein
MRRMTRNWLSSRTDCQLHKLLDRWGFDTRRGIRIRTELARRIGGEVELTSGRVDQGTLSRSVQRNANQRVHTNLGRCHRRVPHVSQKA